MPYHPHALIECEPYRGHYPLHTVLSCAGYAKGIRPTISIAPHIPYCPHFYWPHPPRPEKALPRIYRITRILLPRINCAVAGPPRVPCFPHFRAVYNPHSAGQKFRICIRIPYFLTACAPHSGPYPVYDVLFASITACAPHSGRIPRIPHNPYSLTAYKPCRGHNPRRYRISRIFFTVYKLRSGRVQPRVPHDPHSLTVYKLRSGRARLMCCISRILLLRVNRTVAIAPRCRITRIFSPCINCAVAVSFCGCCITLIFYRI